MNPLSGIDAAFLYMETPTAPMNEVGTIVLAPPGPSWSSERILARLEERLPRMAPLRRRLARAPLGLDHPVWVDDPDFSLADHVHRVAVPAPGTDRILAEFVAKIAAQRLDRSRPLWELWIVEGLAEGRVAVVLKLHHAVADGISLAELMLGLVDSSPDFDDAEAPGNAWEAGAPPTTGTLTRHALSQVALRPLRFARALARTGPAALAVARSALRPRITAPQAALPFTAPRTRFNGAISRRRTVAYGTANLEDMKLVKSVFGTTLNDVVLAACTQSLRNYLAAHGDLPDRPLVAAVPVSVRTPEQMDTFGNRVSLLFVHLPVQLADPVEQLHAIRAAAWKAKQLHGRLGGETLRDWVQLTWPGLFAKAARLYSHAKLANRHRPIHNLVISNVPGPREPLYAAGARVVAAYPHGPVCEGAGLNITVFSYLDSVYVGVLACRESVPDAWDIAPGFGAAVGDLVKRALEQAPEALRPECSIA